MAKLLIFILLFTVLLAGCQAGRALTPASLPVWTPIPVPATAPAVEAAPTSAPRPTATAAAADSEIPAEDLPLSGALEAARGYFAALEAGDFATAASYYSNFSLMMAGLTRSEAALALQGEMASGTEWSALEVKDTRWFDRRTPLVHMVYQKATKDAKTGQTTQAQVDELWPVRLENGQWRYNRDNLIDYQVLDVPEQTTAGLTVKPRQLARYSDRVRLTLMAQNRTNDPIVLGQANEVMAAFTFKDQKVEAEKKQLIFDRLRSYPEVTLDVKGLFETFPDGLILRQWKNVKVAPWFTFKFTD